MTRNLPNFDGEKETLWTGKSIVHRFIEAANLSWHYLETGNPGKPAVVFLHGMPECAFAWHHQITALSDSFHCITLDLKGYGQSDTTLDTDYDYAAQAAELVSVFDVLGLQNFSLVTHDRGSVIADHLCAVPGMNQRIQRYIRMQQSGNRPHSEPRPPHKMFHSQQGIDLLKSGALQERAYSTERDMAIVAIPIDERDKARIDMESRLPGVPESISASFVSAGFDKELEDRMNGLFDKMTMPVLFLQGSLDLGQQPSEYETVTSEVADGQLRFIEAGHFLHLEDPDSVTGAIREFLTETH